MKGFDLKGLSFDDLITLRDSVESLIGKRVMAEKRSLEERLTRLSRFTGETARSPAGRSLKGRKAAPKYRNPANPDETWAGRGMKPRWLQALLNEGRQIEEFAIPAGAEKRRSARAPSRGAKKAARGRKAAPKKTRRARRAA